jgi:hypothetical protein
MGLVPEFFVKCSVAIAAHDRRQAGGFGVIAVLSLVRVRIPGHFLKIGFASIPVSDLLRPT